jgi:ketosteroid isomerase-like protein
MPKKQSRQKKNLARRFFSVLGPGLITGAADDDPSGVATYSIAGPFVSLATAGKDIEKIVSYWSDDAVLIFPGQPVLEGKAAIRAYVTASLNTTGFKIHWVSQKPVFSPDGKFAYMRGTDELTLPGPNGTPMTLHLRGISLWRFDPDGQWRCVVDISNEEPPPAPKS